MIVTILKEKLKEIADITTSVCPTKTDIGVLNYFYLSAEEGKIKISATDLEINYQTEFPARVLKEGKALIPAKQFEKIINNFYEEEVTLEAKENVLYIRGNKSFSNIPTLYEEEFPILSEVNKKNYFEIDNDIFEKCIEKLYPILSTSDIRPEYAGIYFDLKNEKLNLVATDTIRLGVQKVKSQFFETNVQNISVLLPKRIVEEYKKIKRKSGKVRLYFEETQISLEILNNLFTTKISAVEYPNYLDIAKPTSFLFTFLVNKNLIIKALRLAKVFLNELKEVEFTFKLNENKLIIYSRNELLGETKNEVEIIIEENNISDEEFKINFHLDFVYDGFNVIDSDEVFCGFFATSSENTPLYLRSSLDDDFVYITIHR